MGLFDILKGIVGIANHANALANHFNQPDQVYLPQFINPKDDQAGSQWTSGDWINQEGERRRKMMLLGKWLEENGYGGSNVTPEGIANTPPLGRVGYSQF